MTSSFSVSVTTCDRPTILNGSVAPPDETVGYQEAYTVTCDTSFGISGSTTMACEDGGDFDQTPLCKGKL